MPRYPPPRWLDYSPLNTPLRGTSLLPIKLPIPKEHSYNIPRGYWFTDNDLLNYCSDWGYTLACIIDLTYTNYYDPKLFTDRGVKHVKIYVEGHSVPNFFAVKRFLEVVKDVDETSPGGIVAVHCTHGVNRTGYLICRYLIDVLGWSPDRAIEEFASARGHPIERKNYVWDLRSHQH
ncbi:unnamed protein product [Taenia asiatica]|uniref:TYR_PHOSPHATASE_2 domain-containing protein n=1 Tax=Taenia asiatica TaxID=60517 RepID=A0A0R3WA09_TAEAS|nr:unnamed protein product [Taenia asiatica]